MKASYVQQGESLNFVNTGSAAIAAGEIVPLTTRIGVAGTEIPVGGLGTVHVVGVFEIPKKAGEALAVGTAVYYSADGITATATDNTPAGYVTAAAATADASVRVKLLG